MDLSLFLRRWIVQAALAVDAFAFLVLVLEILVPGFVTPFLNLPLVLLGAFVFTLEAAVWDEAVTSSWRRLLWTVPILLLVLPVLGYAWFVLNGLGRSGLVLWSSLLVLVLLSLYALTFSVKDGE